MSNYGCEICGATYGEAVSFPGNRVARSCMECLNEWSRAMQGDDTALHATYIELLVATKDPAIDRTAFERTVKAQKRLGNLWDEWVANHERTVAS